MVDFMFTRCLAVELAPDGISVNAVSPGVVRTNLQMSAGLFSTRAEYEQWEKSMESTHPLGRIGQPVEVARPVLFLASTESGWITGANLEVDGGRAAV